MGQGNNQWAYESQKTKGNFTRRTYMTNKSESTPIEKLVANVLETRFEDICQDDLEHAKIRIIDVLGCLIGGACDSGNKSLVDLVKEWGGKKESTILIYGGKVPACNAAMTNSILCRSFDFEPVSPVTDDISGGGHLSGSTVLTAIALGELKGVDGKELLTALLVGDDMATRVIASSSGPMKTWPKHTGTGSINGFGTTAIAGRLLGLNKLQMKNAFGIILNEMGGNFQMIWDGTTAFKLDQGTSARNSIFTAQLAKAGWTGAGDALHSRFGYYNIFTEGCQHPEAVTKDLGKRFWSDGTIKPYPCCRMNHSAIDCALAITNKYNISARDIKEVILCVSPIAASHICSKPFEIGEFPHGNAIFSFQYTVGTALLRKSVKPEHFTEEAIRGPEINAFIKKISVTEQADISREGAVLKVIMHDGTERIESVSVAKGDPRNPLSKEEIIAKFWTNVDFSRAVSKENAEKILALVEKLEKLDSVNKIVKLLVSSS
jgi:2-methylcitrate dehydratase PrpD